jgi:hypothetical protein
LGIEAKFCHFSGGQPKFSLHASHHSNQVQCENVVNNLEGKLNYIGFILLADFWIFVGVKEDTSHSFLVFSFLTQMIANTVPISMYHVIMGTACFKAYLDPDLGSC